MISLLLVPHLAQSEEHSTKITSIQSHQLVYEVVQKKTQSSDADPGIYRLRRGSDDLEPVIKGTVLGLSRSFNGILAQLGITVATFRDEALAVINGRIILFSNTSTEDKATSILELAGKSHPIVDPVTGHVFKLEPVQALDDIRVYKVTIPSAPMGELVLISVRQPSPYGTGVTFGFVVNSQINETSDRSAIELAAKPYLLNYQFLDSPKLRSLVTRQPTDTVLSHVLLSSQGLDRVGDSESISRWRAEVRSILEQLPTTDSDHLPLIHDQTLLKIPRLNLTNGAIEMKLFPSLVLSPPTCLLGLLQVEDPVSRRDLIYVIPRDDLKNESKLLPLIGKTSSGGIRGSVEFQKGLDGSQRPFLFASLGTPSLLASVLPDQNLYQLTSVAQTEYQYHSLLFKVEDRMMISFIYSAGTPKVGTIETIDLGTTLAAKFVSGRPEALSFVHLVYPQNFSNSNYRHFIVVSADTKEGSFTSLVRFDFEDGIVRNLQIIELDKNYHTQDLLERRLRTYREGPFFDTASNEGTLSKMASKPLLTTPYLDLNSNELLNLIATGRKELIGTEYFWLQFEEHGFATANPTGIYRRLPPTDENNAPRDWRKRLESLSVGTIQVRASDVDPERLDEIRSVASLKMEVDKDSGYKGGSDNPEIKFLNASLFSISAGSKSQGDLEFLVSVEQIDGTEKTYRHIKVQAPPGVTFDQLLDAKFIRGRRSSQNILTLVLLFKSTKEGNPKVDQMGGVYAASFKLQETTVAPRFYTIEATGEPGWLTRQTIEASLLRSYVVFDKKGRPLWVDNPMMDRNDPEFTLKQMTVASKGSVALRGLPAAAMLDDVLGNSETKGWQKSEWSIGFHDQFDKAIPIAAKDLSGAAATAGKESKVKGEKEELDQLLSLFPNLPNYLNAFAAKEDPPRHDIVLVEGDLKAQFFRLVRSQYFVHDKAFSPSNGKFNFYIFDKDGTNRSICKELRTIAEVSQKKLLLVDGQDLVRAKGSDPQQNATALAAAAGGGAPDHKKAATEKENTGESGEVGEIKADKEDGHQGHIPLIRMIAAEGDPSLIEIPEQIARMRSAIPMTIVMTPTEYRHLIAENSGDARRYFSENFKIRSEFLSASWGLRPPGSTRASAQIKQAVKEGVSEDAVRVFPELNQVLVNAANPNMPAKHQIVLFPDELKPLMSRLIISRWATSARALSDPKSPLGIWSYRNIDLALMKVPDGSKGKIDQPTVLENYSAISQIEKSRRPVVVADLADILAAGRPDVAEEERPFRLVDPTAHNQDETGLGLESNHANEMKENLPHLLWLLAAEGQQIQPQVGASWTLAGAVPPRVPTILYGVRQDYDKLVADLSFERRFIDIEKEFEVIHLGEPPVDVRRGLLLSVFNDRSFVRGLELKFQVGSDNARGDASEVVAILVARVEQVARALKQNPTSAFIRVFSELQPFVTQDQTIRRKRVFDKDAIERLLARVFPIGLRLESLPPEDPLHVVSDTVRAVVKWQEKGFRGYSDLKRKVAEMLFSQTESGQDDSRPIPNSAIFKGPTSTGKTFLLTTFFDLLGLERFDPHNPNKPAGYYMIKVQEILDDKKDGEDSSRMTASRVVELAENFLCLNGRGIIVADDLHKAQSTEILRTLMAFFSSMFEAPKGMFRVRCLDGEARDIPIRNSGLYITVNPTQDKTMKERFVGPSELDNEILASISRTDQIIESSFLARFAGKFDMSRFPAGAKVSSIIGRVRDASQTEFVRRQSLILTSPHAVGLLANRFDDANARQILSPATTSLLEIPRDVVQAPIILIDLKNIAKRKVLDHGTFGGDLYQNILDSAPPRGKGEEVDRDTVRSVVKDLIAYRAVDGQSAPSMLDFLSFTLDGFRLHAFQALLEGIQESQFFNESVETRRFFLSEMLISMFDQLTEWSTVPLNNVSINPQDFGWTSQGKISEFIEALKERSERPQMGMASTKYFRHNFTARQDGSSLVLSGESAGDRRILSVMSESAWKLHQILSKYLAAYYRVSDIQRLPDGRQWIENLDSRIDPALISETGAQITEVYLEFIQSIFDQDLLEYKNVTSSDRPRLYPIGRYDQARLFLEVFEKAIVSLPWAKMAQFEYSGMKVASEDHNLGYLPKFQDYIFNNTFSPFDTVTTDTIFQSITGHPNFKSVDKGEHKQSLDRFNRLCGQMLFTDSDQKGDSQ
jgi:hypothetical protein